LTTGRPTATTVQVTTLSTTTTTGAGHVCIVGDFCMHSSCQLFTGWDGAVRCATGCTLDTCQGDADCPADSWCDRGPGPSGYCCSSCR
jgi:hypothetical protein